MPIEFGETAESALSQIILKSNELQLELEDHPCNEGCVDDDEWKLFKKDLRNRKRFADQEKLEKLHFTKRQTMTATNTWKSRLLERRKQKESKDLLECPITFDNRASSRTRRQKQSFLTPLLPPLLPPLMTPSFRPVEEADDDNDDCHQEDKSHGRRSSRRISDAMKQKIKTFNALKHLKHSLSFVNEHNKGQL